MIIARCERPRNNAYELNIRKLTFSTRINVHEESVYCANGCLKVFTSWKNDPYRNNCYYRRTVLYFHFIRRGDTVENKGTVLHYYYYYYTKVFPSANRCLSRTDYGLFEARGSGKSCPRAKT